MKLEDLTGDDRTLVVVALRALSGSEVTHIMQPAPPASLQARNHQLRIFWRGGKYFGNSPDGSSPAEMKPDMKSTNENENRRGLLISAGQLLFGERWQTELARALDCRTADVSGSGFLVTDQYLSVYGMTCVNSSRTEAPKWS